VPRSGATASSSGAATCDARRARDTWTSTRANSGDTCRLRIRQPNAGI